MECERCGNGVGRRTLVRGYTIEESTVSVCPSLVCGLKVEVALCAACLAARWAPMLILTALNRAESKATVGVRGWRMSESHTHQIIPGVMLTRGIDVAAIMNLRQVTEQFLEWLRASSPDEVRESVPMVDYHGFGKGRLPEDLVARTLAPYGLVPSDIQAELVYVGRDLRREKHFHVGSRAFNVVLGTGEGFEDPHRASVYMDNRWFGLRYGDRVEIPKGTPHGFKVMRGGALHFLSVQSPPIVSGHGEDDYRRIA